MTLEMAIQKIPFSLCFELYKTIEYFSFKFRTLLGSCKNIWGYLKKRDNPNLFKVTFGNYSFSEVGKFLEKNFSGRKRERTFFNPRVLTKLTRKITKPMLRMEPPIMATNV